MRGLKAVLLVLLLAVPSPSQQARTPTVAGSLVEHLPAILPDISTWERSSGFTGLETPRGRFEYELYVDPARGASYAVTRYRIQIDDPEEALRAGFSDTEKLQWDVDGRKLHRFECRPVPDSPCVWSEMAAGSPEFLKELPSILAVYSVHRKLLQDRERRSQGRD
jgi:hypothetical protein